MEKTIECITHGSKLTEAERARFKGKKLTPDEMMEILLNGAPGLLILMSRKNNLDDNVVVEYRQVESKE